MLPPRTKVRKQSSLLATRKTTGIIPVVFLVPWCAELEAVRQFCTCILMLEMYEANR